MSVSFHLSWPPRQVTHLEDPLSEGAGPIWWLSRRHCVCLNISRRRRGTPGSGPSSLPTSFYKNPPERQHNKGHSARCNIVQREFPGKKKLKTWFEAGKELKVICKQQFSKITNPRLTWMRHSYKMDCYLGAKWIWFYLTPRKKLSGNSLCRVSCLFLGSGEVERHSSGSITFWFLAPLKGNQLFNVTLSSNILQHL